MRLGKGILVGQGLCSCRLSDNAVGTAGAEPLPYASCRLLAAGEIAQTELLELTKRYNHIRIDKYVIMPNHVHAIIAVERQEQSPRPTMMDIICAYKSITTKRYNRICETTGKTLWQSRFHDHIIRNESEYLRIWQYIDDNLAKWDEDCYHN